MSVETKTSSPEEEQKYANWKAPETGKEKPEPKETPDEAYIRTRVETILQGKENDHKERKEAVVTTAQDLLNRYKIGTQPDKEFLNELIDQAEKHVLVSNAIRESSSDPEKRKGNIEEARQYQEELRAKEPEFVQKAIKSLRKRKGILEPETSHQKETPNEAYIRAEIEEAFPPADKELTDTRIKILTKAQDILNKYRTGIKPDKEYLNGIIALATSQILTPIQRREMPLQGENKASAAEKSLQWQKNLEAREPEFIQEAIKELYQRQEVINKSPQSEIIPPYQASPESRVTSNKEQSATNTKEFKPESNTEKAEKEHIKVEIGQRWAFKKEAGIEGFREVLKVDENNNMVVLSATNLEQQQFEKNKEISGNAGTASPHKIVRLDFLKKYGVLLPPRQESQQKAA